MSKEEFYRKYANTPIDFRLYPIILRIWEDEKGRQSASYTNLSEIYIQLHERDIDISAPVQAFLNDHTLSGK